MAMVRELLKDGPVDREDGKMIRLLGIMIVTATVLAAAGCGPEVRYCSNCEASVVQADADGRARLVRGRCRVGGRDIDCAREHALCPECRKT